MLILNCDFDTGWLRHVFLGGGSRSVWASERILQTVADVVRNAGIRKSCGRSNRTLNRIISIKSMS